MTILLTLVLGLSAWAKPDLYPSWRKFQEACREHRLEAAQFVIEAPEIGVETYFPTLSLEAGQTRFSFERFRDSLAKIFDEEPDGMAHDRGRSLYGMHKKIKAVFYRGKLVIVDGHHRALISAYIGAKTIPVKILADFSALSPAKFRETMEKRGWGHWRNYRGSQMRFRDLCNLEDDPNFQLARLIIRRVEARVENGRLIISNSRGARLSIAIKINSDIPFFEIHLADALRRGQVEFDPSRDRDDLEKEELKEYLEILHAKARAKTSPLRKVLLLSKPTSVAKLDLEQIVIEHLQQKSCINKLVAEESD